MLRTKALSLATVLVTLLASAAAVAQDATTPPPAAPPAAEPTPAAPPPAPADVVVGDAPAATPAADEQTEEIVVTGTRIRRKDLTTPAPVTVINRDQITASGKVSIGDFLQALPEQGNAINTQINNGGDGSTRVNLRGLGVERTLVLVNGRRFVPGGTGADAAVDLNSIPTAAVERIEILKDGASAIYGSDAIAGVVNIITRKGYTGTDVTAFAGTSSRGDGTVYDLNLTTGVNGDRGSVVFSAGFYRMDEVWAGDRDWSERPLAYNYRTGEEYVLGSYGVPQGALDLFEAAPAFGTGSATWQALVNEYYTGATTGTYKGWTASTFIFDPGQGPGGVDWRAFVDPDDTYNFQPENYLVTPQQRISLYATGDTRLGDVGRGYFEASYVNRRSDQAIAPEPLFTDGEDLTIAATNQFNPFGVEITPSTGGVYRRLTEFGRREDEQDLDTFRVVTGVDGTLPDILGPASGWFWDANVNYGRTQGINLKTGRLLLPNLQAAVGPSFNFGTAEAPSWGCVGDPTNATTAAATRIDGCVPLDLFHGAGSITPEQIANLTYAGTLRGTNAMMGAQVNTSGELVQLMADRPIGLALGYEYRRLSGSFIPDPVTVAGFTTGNKGTATEGDYYVHEGYAELSVPIISGMVGVQDLEATIAARAFDYSTFGSDWTYKLGARYKPIPDVTIRGTFSTAFRAPSIFELYGGLFDTFPNASDPCSDLTTAPPDVAAACLAQHPGMPAGGTGDTRTQLRGQEGGSEDLDPETADIFTVGLVFEPRWVKNLSVTLDYYAINLDDSISSLGYSTILNSCYSGSRQHCDLIDRDPISYRIRTITNRQTNVGGTETAGLDLSTRYQLPTAFGRWGFGLDVTYLQKYDEIQADGTVVEGVGNYDLADQGTYGIYPRWKGNASVSWGWKGLAAGVNTRYIHSFEECSPSNGRSGTTGSCSDNPLGLSRDVDAYNVWDAMLGYTLTSGLGRTNVAVGVQNVFDKEPPKIYNAFTASTDPSAYDLMGRFLYARLSQTY